MFIEFFIQVFIVVIGNNDTIEVDRKTIATCGYI
jgi:hypothetical protein